MAPFSNPSTVLKQADGLVSVGQPHAALQSLSDLFASKRFRSTPLPMLEPIMIRFVELCVETRRGRQAKEGLMQYKNIAQNVDTSSVERVVQRLVGEANKRVTEAVDKAAKVTAGGVEVEDLEASETPESILLGAVSGDQSKDRTDRALVTPWLKFLWEAYRTSLETLKNNARLEGIYQQIAQAAFKFCLAYNRRVEFRRLCETLRLHLSNVAKYSHQPHAINLADPETLQHHLDTRFAQLQTSVQLELWQEAFRSVEDVHMLLTMAKAFTTTSGKQARPAMLAGYYEKCTKVFLMNGGGGAGALWHAAAWGRYYAVITSIPKEAGLPSQEELAGQVLVSALSVPVNTDLDESGTEAKGKTARLTALLGLARPPTRKRLLADARVADVLRLSPPLVQKLYDVLEVQFDPLTLCAEVAPILESLEAEVVYKDYVPLLREAVLSRLLSQLSEVYSTMKLSQLLDLVKPLGESWGEGRVEAYVMGCARRGELSVRIDHLAGSVEFVDEGFAGVNEDSIGTGIGARDGGVQPSVGELVRKRLGNVAMCLHSSLAKIDPPAQTPAEDQDAKLEVLVKAVNAERKALALRRALVARRRELNSELSVRKEKEESSRLAEIARKRKEEDGKREREAMRAKEVERAKRERENIQRVEAEKYAQSLLKVGTLKEKDLEKLDKFDTENLLEMQVKQLEKEKKETSQRLRVIAKRVDHLERAYRKEEAPLLAQDYAQQQLADRETHAVLQTQLKVGSVQHHKEELETKKRMLRMMEDYQKRREDLVRKKGEEFARKRDEATRRCEEEKTKRRKAVEKKREEERKAREEEERVRRQEEEEERRLEDERAAAEEAERAEEERVRLEAEAEEAAKVEKARKAREEREADRAAAAEKARLQQQREEEAERRAAERRKAAVAPPAVSRSALSSREGGSDPWRRSATPQSSVPAAPTRASMAPPRSDSPAGGAAPASKYRPGALGGGGGGWREREKARADGGGGAAPPPPPARSETPVKKDSTEDDGFQTVSKAPVWKPKRGGRP